MFFGRRKLKIDKKWRLSIAPVIVKKLGDSCLLKMGDDGCLEIHKTPTDLSTIKDFSNVFVVKIRTSKRYPSITIPEYFRKNSTSFYFGKTVTLAGKGEYLVLWPRQSSN